MDSAEHHGIYSGPLSLATTIGQDWQSLHSHCFTTYFILLLIKIFGSDAMWVRNIERFLFGLEL